MKQIFKVIFIFSLTLLSSTNVFSEAKIFSNSVDTCVVNKGKVFCWNVHMNKLIPVPEDLNDVDEVSFISNHICAKEVGLGWSCWSGRSTTFITPTMFEIQNFLPVDAKYLSGRSCYTKNGKVKCLNADKFNVENFAPSGKLFSKFNMSDISGFACGIEKFTDKVFCWGEGNMSNGFTLAYQNRHKIYNVPEGLKADEVRAGSLNACSIDSRTKHPVCWGVSDWSSVTPKFPVDILSFDDRVACTLSKNKVNCWGAFIHNEVLYERTFKSPSDISVGLYLCVIDGKKVLCDDFFGYTAELPLPKGFL